MENKFKIGDFVIVTQIPESNHWICNSSERIFTLFSIDNFYATTKSRTHGLSGCHFKLYNQTLESYNYLIPLF